MTPGNNEFSFEHWFARSLNQAEEDKYSVSASEKYRSIKQNRSKEKSLMQLN